MKKWGKIGLVLVLAFVSLSVLVACGGGAGKEYAGSYRNTSYKYSDGSGEADPTWVLTLTEDGKGTSARGGSEYGLTWKVKGNEITVTETFMGMKNEYSGTIETKKITLQTGEPGADFSATMIFEAE